MTIHIENFQVSKHLENGFRETLGALVPVEELEEEIQRNFSVRQRNCMQTLVAVEGLVDRVVGTISIYFEPKLSRDCRPAAHIEDVAVHPDWQGRGVGALLMETALAIIRDHGCYKVVLNCNESKIGFYEKHGFRQDGICMRLDLERDLK